MGATGFAIAAPLTHNTPVAIAALSIADAGEAGQPLSPFLNPLLDVLQGDLTCRALPRTYR